MGDTDAGEESVVAETEPDDEDGSSATTHQDPPTLLELLQGFYNNRYYWEIAKSVVIFAVALKVAHECKHIAIPLREYEPFSYLTVCTCR